MDELLSRGVISLRPLGFRLKRPTESHHIERGLREGGHVDRGSIEDDGALGVDDDAYALCRASYASLFGGAVGEAHGPISVAEEWVFEVVFRTECGVVFAGVEAHAQDARVLGVVGALEVAEPATLNRSARGVSDRVEPEHEVAPAIIS